MNAVAAAPRPVPLARIQLRRVPVRTPVESAGAPVFHVFEELFERAVAHGQERTGAREPGRRS